MGHGEILPTGAARTRSGQALWPRLGSGEVGRPVGAEHWCAPGIDGRRHGAPAKLAEAVQSFAWKVLFRALLPFGREPW